MTICARRGCGVDFDASSKASTCAYHPGVPRFRDQLKSWSCCETENKAVLDFEDFVAIKGCTTADAHTDEKQPLPDDPKRANTSAGPGDDGNADTGASEPSGALGTTELAQALPSALTGATLLAAQKAEAARRGGAGNGAAPSGPAAGSAAKEKEEEEEEDPEDAAIPDGAQCKRTGCSATYSASGGARKREAEECKYHPRQAIFHEGSKGYICCKRRVLEFSEFLAIEPCTKAKKGHLYVGKPKATADGEEEPAQCRMDHYETPVDIRLTVYAKGADMDKSKIEMRNDAVDFSIWLPPSTPSASQARRFKKTLELFSDIDPAASSFAATKFKIDLVLVKAVKGVSWPSLERSDRVVGYGLTFGRRLDAQTNAAH